MIEFIVVVVVVLLAGYIVANNHHRIRSLAAAVTAGTVVGEAMPTVPDDVDHNHSDDRHPHIDDGHTHGGSDGGFDGTP